MSDPYVVAVTQRKGGDGKTTIATHVAAGLALKGARVCLIDTDSQGDAARLFGMRPDDGLYRWLGQGVDLSEVLTPVPESAYVPAGSTGTGALVLIRSASLTAAIPSLNENRFTLAERVRALAGTVDVVVLDTAPTLSVFDIYVKLATDGYLFVTQPEHLSLEGLADGIAEVDRIGNMRERAGYDRPRVLGIVANKVRANTDTHRYFMETEIGGRYGALAWAPAVMLRTVFTQAAAAGQMIYRYRPGSAEGRDLLRIVDKLVEVLTQ